VVFVLQFLRILFVHEDFTNHEWTRIDANELIKFAACPAVARRAKEDTLVSILRLLSRRLWLRLCCSAFSRGYFSEAYSRFDRRTGVVAVRGTAPRIVREHLRPERLAAVRKLQMHRKISIVILRLLVLELDT
jgi:hypothetical protein